jgi:universal stress protein E
MLDVHRLLVAIDLHRDGATLTAGSCFATDQAVELAKHLGGQVVLLHAMHPDRPAKHRPEDVGPEDVAGHTLDQVADRFRSIGVLAEVAITEEAPGLAIVERVIRDRIDLVFVGRRNERSQGPMALGSVSSQLLRSCPCAVWVAKPGSDVAPRRVLAASDLSATSERVIEYAAFVAGHYDAELHVVHAFQLRASAELEGRVGADLFLRAEREQRVHRLTQQVERASGARATAIHAVNARPSEAIRDRSRRLQPDLVVMGTATRRRIVGDTAMRLLARLDCSLLTVKPDDFVCPVVIE